MLELQPQVEHGEWHCHSSTFRVNQAWGFLLGFSKCSCVFGPDFTVNKFINAKKHVLQFPRVRVFRDVSSLNHIGDRHAWYCYMVLLWKKLGHYGFTHYWRIIGGLCSRDPSHGVCLWELSRSHLLLSSMSASSWLDVAMVHGFKCSLPNEHALHFDNLIWYSLQKSSSSTSSQPLQYEGHS